MQERKLREEKDVLLDVLRNKYEDVAETSKEREGEIGRLKRQVGEIEAVYEEKL